MARVIILRFRVASGREEEWERFIGQRAAEMTRDEGFERMYLLGAGTDPPEYRLVTWWAHIERPGAWVRTQVYELSESEEHPGIVVGPVEHEVLDVVKEF